MNFIFKIVPKLIWFQDVKFIVGLLMLVRQTLIDIQKGKETESLALDGLIIKVHDKLLPEQYQKTATPPEIEEVVQLTIKLYKAASHLIT